MTFEVNIGTEWSLHKHPKAVCQVDIISFTKWTHLKNSKVRGSLERWPKRWPNDHHFLSFWVLTDTSPQRERSNGYLASQNKSPSNKGLIPQSHEIYSYTCSVAQLVAPIYWLKLFINNGAFSQITGRYRLRPQNPGSLRDEICCGHLSSSMSPWSNPPQKQERGRNAWCGSQHFRIGQLLMGSRGSKKGRSCSLGVGLVFLKAKRGWTRILWGSTFWVWILKIHWHFKRPQCFFYKLFLFCLRPLRLVWCLSCNLHCFDEF